MFQLFVLCDWLRRTIMQHSIPTWLPNVSIFIATWSASFFSMANLGLQIPALDLLQPFVFTFINDTYSNRYGIPPSHLKLDVITTSSVALLWVGALFGAVISIPLSNRFGRRLTLMVFPNVAVVIGVISISFCKYSQLYELLLSGRFILGIAAGMSLSVLPVYIIEISPVECRGFVSCFPNSQLLTWFLVALLLATPSAFLNEIGWPIMLSMPVFFALMQLALTPLHPESLSFLIGAKSTDDRPLVFLRQYHGVSGVRELHKVVDYHKGESRLVVPNFQYHRGFCSDKRIQKLCSLAIVLGILFASSGTILFQSYPISILKPILPKSITRETLTIVTIAIIAASYSSGFLIERFGRRRPLLLVNFVATGIYVAIFVFIYVLSSDTKTWSWSSWVCIILILMQLFAVNLVPSNISLFATLESTPYQLRSFISAITVSVVALWMFSISVIYPVIVNLFAAWTIVVLLLIPFTISTIYLVFYYQEPQFSTIMANYRSLYKVSIESSSIITDSEFPMYDSFGENK